MKVDGYGASDDLIYVRIGGVVVHEVGAYVSIRCDRRWYREALEFRARCGAGGRAHAIYDGCWSFAAGQLDDGRSIPDGWMLRVAQEPPTASSG